jgi:cyclic pyranopterin phosphate synthase
MPEGADITYIQAQDSLTNLEIISLLKEVFIPLGFQKIRLTGGEPLLRRDLVSLVEAIANLSGVEDLSMTTNGFLLEELAKPLYLAGLKRINISLDSLDRDVFRQITGRNLWEKVWAGILTAHEVGFDPLKLNVVVVPDVNDREILDLAALSIDRHWHIRFIEFMPIGNDNLFTHKGWVDSATLRQQISDRYGLDASQCKGNGPADIFQIPNAKGTLGFISQMSECFCDRCNRMRLSADGLLRPCLLNESGQIDLKAAMRGNQDFASLRIAVRELLNMKDEINFKERDRGTTEQNPYFRTMSQIGG